MALPFFDGVRDHVFTIQKTKTKRDREGLSCYNFLALLWYANQPRAIIINCILTTAWYLSLTTKAALDKISSISTHMTISFKPQIPGVYYHWGFWFILFSVECNRIIKIKIYLHP